MEDINYRSERGLNKSVIRALTEESLWVKNHEHIFVLGPTGVGKSYLASALAQKACRDGYAVYYTRAAALFREAEPGTSRWQSWATVETPEPDRRSGDR